MSLEQQLDALPRELSQRLDARGFERERLLSWARVLGHDVDERNRLAGEVVPVAADDVVEAPLPRDGQHGHFEQLGAQALGEGRLAVCVLAGGMATRMGGVVKALVEVVAGKTFLDLRLAEQAQIGRAHGEAPPLWLMTSEPTEGPIREALGDRCDGAQVGTFEQFVSLRLDPDGGLFRDDDGEPSVYATGHGDLPEALKRSGLLERFNARGGRWLWISNLDNLGAGVDLALLGQHIASGAALSVELVAKAPGDQGGGPVLYQGRPIIAEHFRLPHGFDPDSIPVFNTNTFLVDSQKLAELTMDWTYVEVRKQVGERKAVQFERLLGEMTTALTPRFVKVSRTGDDSRFLPMKSHDDLTRAGDAIAALMRRLSSTS